MMDDLRTVHPFHHTEDRKYHCYPRIQKSQVDNVNGYKLREWFEKNTNTNTNTNNFISHQILKQNNIS